MELAIGVYPIPKFTHSEIERFLDGSLTSRSNQNGYNIRNAIVFETPPTLNNSYFDGLFSQNFSNFLDRCLVKEVANRAGLQALLVCILPQKTLAIETRIWR